MVLNNHLEHGLEGFEGKFATWDIYKAMPITPYSLSIKGRRLQSWLYMLMT
jgi:hypothetical protein